MHIQNGAKVETPQNNPHFIIDRYIEEDEMAQVIGERSAYLLIFLGQCLDYEGGIHNYGFFIKVKSKVTPCEKHGVISEPWGDVTS